jgi:hypothetical protein
MYSWLPAFPVMSHPYRLLLKLGKNPPIPCEEFREHATLFFVIGFPELPTLQCIFGKTGDMKDYVQNVARSSSDRSRAGAAAGDQARPEAGRGQGLPIPPTVP